MEQHQKKERENRWRQGDRSSPKSGVKLPLPSRWAAATPITTATLKVLIAKAKANNVPNDNIERIIKKAAWRDGSKNSYENNTYEGYGPGGVAVIVETPDR